MEVAVPLTWEPSPPPHRPVVGRFGGGSTCRRRRPPERGAGKRRVVKLENPHHEHNAIFRVECVCDPPELHPEFRMLPNSSVIQADSAHAAPGPVRVDVERRAAGNPERATASRWTHLGIASARWACVSRTLLRRRSPLRVAWWPPVGSAVDQAGASPGTTVGPHSRRGANHRPASGIFPTSH